MPLHFIDAAHRDAHGAPQAPLAPAEAPGHGEGAERAAAPVLAFVVPGQPVPKGRPRFGTRAGRPVTYTDGKTLSYERTVAWYAGQGWRGVGPLVEPVRVEVVAVLKRPQALYRRKDPDGELHAPGRPDLDNCIKAVLDGLNQSGVWRDDAQVVEVTGRKIYHGKAGAPETRVRVWRVEG